MQSAVSHAKSGSCGAAAFRADYIHHSLSLGKVELAVEEGAFGKFSCLSSNSAGAEYGAQNLLSDKDTAMARKLNDVLARVAVGSAENKSYSLVKSLALKNDFSIGGGVAV